MRLIAPGEAYFERLRALSAKTRLSALTLTRDGERCETLRSVRWGKLVRCEAHGELEGSTPPTSCDASLASFASHP